MSYTVLVSGGAQGLGKDFCLHLKKLGHKVFFTSSKENENALYWDMQKEESTKALIESLKERKIEVDLFIHCAHIFSETKLIPMVKTSEFKHSLISNIVPLFELTKFLSRDMARRSFGRILFVGSLISQYGGAGKVSYITEKAAMDGLVRAFDAEFSNKNVLTNIIHPNLFESSDVSQRVSEDMIKKMKAASPNGELLSIKEILEVAIPLLSHESTRSGESILIDGGVKW